MKEPYLQRNLFEAEALCSMMPAIKKYIKSDKDKVDFLEEVMREISLRPYNRTDFDKIIILSDIIEILSDELDKLEESYYNSMDSDEIPFW